MRARLGIALATALLSALGSSLLGCDRRLEPYVPSEDEPRAPERPVQIPGLARPNPQLEEGVPVASSPARGTSPAVGGPGLSGRISLAEGATVPDGSVLFVIARTPQPGPPLAVKRLPPGPFPMAFSLGPQDVMIQGRPFQGPLALTARVDADGNPMTRGPEDLVAALDAPVQPGDSELQLVLGPAQP